MSQEAAVLTREWYVKLEEQSASTFMNLPIEFQLKGYDYNFIGKSYYNFFRSENNTRQDKLTLAKKFLKFLRSINKNRAKQELGEEFFLCFEYFMDNFSELLAKQDTIHLEALDVMLQAIDKSQFIEDVINVEELQRRVKNLEKVQQREEVIDVEFEEISSEYAALNHVDDSVKHQFLLSSEEKASNELSG